MGNNTWQAIQPLHPSVNTTKEDSLNTTSVAFTDLLNMVKKLSVAGGVISLLLIVLTCATLVYYQLQRVRNVCVTDCC